MLSVVQKSSNSAPIQASRMTTVRAATAEDISSIVNMAHEMYLESTYQSVPFNRNEVAAFAYELISNPKAIPLLCFHGSEPVGMMGLSIVGYFFSPQTRLAIDHALFVKKSHRGGLAAVRLVRAGLKWAHDNGAHSIVLGATALSDNSRAYALYEHLGFREIGRVFSRRIG